MLRTKLPTFCIAMRSVLTAALVLIVLLGGLWTQAIHAETGNAKRPYLETLPPELDDIDRQLKRENYQELDLQAWIDQLSGAQSRLTDCVNNTEKTVARLNGDLESLGEAVRGEAADVARKRKDVRNEISTQERKLGECRVLLLRSEDLLQKINALYKAALAERLFSKGPSLPVLLLDNWNNAGNLSASTLQFVQQHAGLDNLSAWEWLVLGLLMLAAYWIGRVLRARARQRVAAQAVNVELGTDFSGALLAAFKHYMPRLLAALVAVAYIYLTTHSVRPIPFVNIMLYGLPVYLLASVFIRFLFTPIHPYRKPLRVSDEFGRRMARRLRVLALLAYVGYLLFSTLLSQHIPQEAYLLVRAIYAGLLFLNLAWALLLVARLRSKDEFRWIGYLIALVLIAGLGAEWLGYRNLALMMVRVVAGSLFAFGMVIVLVRLANEFYDVLEQGEGGWATRLRNLIGVAAGKSIPGLIWLRFSTYLVLWLLFGYALLRIWRVPGSFIQRVEDTLTQGFTLGEFELVPLRVLLALALFAILVPLARWAQTRVDRHWLRYARLEHGAREAIITITGYVMITLAAIVGLSIAGFEFRNLAIIAGALSVGIGFGLQNIVNNFVSGLILLFERPVKTGDWVVVGNTEGYVKRIRIRSTQIQTFDRADVIVPNSELISQQVTNWMLYDRQGRARVPVGVAYGSDTQKVKRVLEEVAQAHPEVINDGSYPEPKVLFLGFGDSALNFEVRCFVRNIDNRLQVISDLNFAIDAAFRQEGIEIPFPQRDLHVRSLPPGYRPPAED